MQFVKPLTFAEAQAALGERHPVTSTLNSAKWADVPVGLRQRAFFSSEVENVRFLQRAQDFLGNFLAGTREENGALKAGGRAQFVKQMMEFAVQEGMGPLDPREAGTIKDIRSQRRLELIFDTNVEQAQQFGYWKQGQDADVLDAFPAQRFIRERTVAKPRKYHEAALNEVRLKSDLPFWLALNPDFDVPWGPWGFGSGCGVEDVDREEAEALGLLAPGEDATPVEKEVNEGLEASTRGLSPVWTAHLESTFGSQVTISGDRVRWTANAPAPKAKKPRKKTTPVVPPAPVIAPPAPVIAPAPVAPAASRVSSAVIDELSPAEKVHLSTAMEAIDSVHGDGPLKAIPFNHAVSKRADGTYWSTHSRAMQIAVKPSASHGSAFHLVHEAGHWIDHIGIPSRFKFASESKGPMDEWRSVVMASAAYKSIEKRPHSEHRDYLLSGRELWARSYAQFIAVKSGAKPLTDWLKRVRNGQTGYSWDSQWAAEDFVPIAAAIEKLFAAMGWLNSTAPVQ